MPRPVVGVYADIAPASWGPWSDRPSVLAPAALGEALQRAGAMVVMLAPGEDEIEQRDLLRMLDALVVFESAEGLDRLLDAARELDLAVRVLDPARVTPASSLAEIEREIAGLL